MARIAGIDLPKEKRVEIGLTYVYGIGRKTANDILAKAGVNPDTRVKDLTDDDEAKIRDAIEQLGVAVEGDLRREIALNIKRLQEIGCYRGIRHRKGPFVVREQRPTQEQEKVLRRPSLIRRSNLYGKVVKQWQRQPLLRSL